MKNQTTSWKAFVDILLLLILSSIDVLVVLARQDDALFPSLIPSRTHSPSARLTQSAILTAPPTILMYAPTVGSLFPEPAGLLPSLVPTVTLEPSRTTSPDSQSSAPSTETLSLSPVIVVSSVPMSFVPIATPVSLAPLAPAISSAPVTSAPIDSSESSSAPTDVMMTTSASISLSPSATTIPSLGPDFNLSVFPSDRPSPLSTLGEVPSYSERPSGMRPNISLSPTAPAETATEIPTLHPSIVPSNFPSTTPTSVLSSLPSSHPSSAPSSRPFSSELPSTNPSKYPPLTSKPTITTNVTNMANLLLHIRGLPSLTGNDIALWESITNQHVLTYWNNISFDSIYISTVQTKLREQVTASNFRRLLNGTELQTGFVYSQQITYGILGIRMPRGDDLFYSPFEEFGGHDYAIRLQQLDAYDPLHPITVVSISSLTFAPSASPSTSTPTILPISRGVEVEKVIIAAVASTVGGLCVIAGAMCYSGRAPEPSTVTNIPTPPILVNDEESSTPEAPLSSLRKDAPLCEESEFLGEDNHSNMERSSMSCDSPLLGVDFSQGSDSPFKIQDLTPTASASTGFITSTCSPISDDYGLILDKWSRSMDQDTVIVEGGVYGRATPPFSNASSPSRSGFKMEIEEIE